MANITSAHNTKQNINQFLPHSYDDDNQDNKPIIQDHMTQLY